jgi:beta-lactamase class A
LNQRRGFPILRWVSLIFLSIAVILTVYQLVRYSRLRSNFASGTVIGNVPVGGLSQEQAAERLIQAYAIPVELYYADSVIQVKPSTIGFQLDLESMMAAADQQRVSQPFWTAFWDYLWNKLPTPSAVPLRATIPEDRLRAYLQNEIADRYDHPAEVAMPRPGSTEFEVGQAGTELDMNRAVTLIEDALRSPTGRIVNLSYSQINPTRPSLQTLQILLQQIIDVSKFDGLAEVYIMDLQSRQEINFAYQQGELLPPEIAFGAQSTIKIPIMISILRLQPEPVPDDVISLMERMIELSENDPADTLMADYLDGNLGPLRVTDDLEKLGLKNTFLAGFFYNGAPLLYRYATPANQRNDVDTNPDEYNQTTPAEISSLLEDIYQCSQDGGGTFAAVFPGQLSQKKCQQMINYLSKNKIGVLFEAGLPDGTQIAHKHAWAVDAVDGLLHGMGDTGIIYTPGGNYIMTVFLYHPTQLVFDPANRMVADMATAVYKYFTLGQ